MLSVASKHRITGDSITGNDLEGGTGKQLQKPQSEQVSWPEFETENLATTTSTYCIQILLSFHIFSIQRQAHRFKIGHVRSFQITHNYKTTDQSKPSMYFY
jgi:hypothetical protein